MGKYPRFKEIDSKLKEQNKAIFERDKKRNKLNVRVSLKVANERNYRHYNDKIVSIIVETIGGYETLIVYGY